MGIFDWKHWIVVLGVVVLVFGTKKLKNLGSDLGESIKGFRHAMSEDEHTLAPLQHIAPEQPGHASEGQAQPAQEPLRNH